MADDIKELTELFKQNLDKMDQLIDAQNQDSGLSSPAIRSRDRPGGGRARGRGMGDEGRNIQSPGGQLGVGMAGVSNIMKQQQIRQQQQKEQDSGLFSPTSGKDDNQPMKINEIDDSSFDSLVMQMRATTWRVRIDNARKNLIEPLYFSLQTLQSELMDFFEKEHKNQMVIQRNQLKFLKAMAPKIKHSLDESVMMWMDRFKKMPLLTTIKTLASGVMSVVKPLAGGIMTLLFGQRKKQRTTVQAIDQQTAFLRTGLLRPMGRFSGLITGSLTALPKMMAQRTESRQAKGEETSGIGRWFRDQMKGSIVLEDQTKKNKEPPFEGADKIPELLEGILTNSKFLPFVWETGKVLEGRMSLLNNQLYSIQLATFYMMKNNLESMSYYAEVGYNNERRDQNLQDLEQQASAEREQKLVELQKETVGAINDADGEEEQEQEARGGMLSKAGMAKALKGGAIIALTGAVGMIGKSVYDALTNPGGENLIHDIASQVMGRELISEVVGQTVDRVIASLPGSSLWASDVHERRGDKYERIANDMNLEKTSSPLSFLPFMGNDDDSNKQIEEQEKQRRREQEERERSQQQNRTDGELIQQLQNNMVLNQEMINNLKEIAKNTKESAKDKGSSYSPVNDSDTILNNGGGAW